jgi:hypothetical protein
MPVGEERRYLARLVIGPVNDGEPAITIKRPEEGLNF